MATLYRKYRPQSFSEVVGQNHIKLTLEYELKSGRLAHSYLFCGPRAVGKTTLSRVLAKSLNCLNRPEDSAEPCNHCQNCLEIISGAALDIIEIDAASHTGVDNVRENIIAGARVSPSTMKYKVFIIDEVHMLSSAAFNALLKIMEEPPAFVVFVLCTTEVHKIPSTIISRCQRFDFKKISVMDIVHKLDYILNAEGIAAEKGVLEAIARYSGGHMRDAESVLGQILALAERKREDQLLTITVEQAELVIPRSSLTQAIQLIEMLAIRDSGNAIRLVNLLVDDGYDLKTFLNDLIELLRQMLLLKINPELLPALGVDLGELITTQMLIVSEKINSTWCLKALQVLMPVRLAFKDTIFGQLPLEMAIVELSEGGVSKPTPVSPTSEPILTSQTKTVIVESCQPVPPSLGVSVSSNGGVVPFESTGALPDLNRILALWSDFISASKQASATLSFSLGVSRPIAVRGNKLILALKHKIHQERLAQVAVKSVAEEVLSRLCQTSMLIEAVLEEAPEILEVVEPVVLAPTASPANDPILDEMLKTFGGQVVG
ncbi:DNA polymerase III, subunit gamma and tau [Candidatus Falkowbacteria bacterium CG10_big_fil_rev_8_21_14_0_10_37_14]|uniref:DNA polymerase III subunit gamma/tau n=1 Tax=Candidatus Falkowbacteria bacterium CG10_big_fil_rev_8_21_14_0_10_37_14 TaxID=1974561 RepID=A0A2M6WSN3_9BACT|nr:DNA polymerase III subunit gamma/tau [Candidatus Falkowbacteria bacterium]PIT95706.1 MAG: DNA polymerase III, subunit gamma and tau [Candidatus Falkowbacteria bacterium CG10_big_fil_rev_8_21_14_0_10_37_14]